MEIIITNQFYKKTLLKQYTKEICPFHFYTWNEFLEKYLFSLRSDTLYYVVSNYHICPEIAQIWLKHLYYIEDKEYSSSKLNHLKQLKEDLEKKGYLKKDKFFKTYLEGKKITFYGIPFTKFHEKIKQELDKIMDVSIMKENDLKKDIRLTSYNTIEEEVIGVAEEITSLLQSGVAIERIKLNTLDTVYQTSIDKIFPMFKIPYQLKKKPSLYSLEPTKEFLKNLDESKSLEELLPYLENYQNSIIFEPILKIFNDYAWEKIRMKDFKETFLYLLKNTNVSLANYKNVVEEINAIEANYENEIVFVLGFVQDTIPKIYKDNEFLSNEEREVLGLDTIFEKNKQEEEKVLSFLKRVPMVYLSFATTSPFNRYSPSVYLEEVKKQFTVIEKVGGYQYSNEQINKLYLASYLDTYFKFNSKHEMLSSLYQEYHDIPYSTYQNRFTGLDIEDLFPFIQNKLNLSFSSMDNFFKCSFRFYLEFIVKLKKFEETTSTIIGKLFHKVLEIIYKEKREDYEIVIKEVFEEFNEGKTLTLKEQFYQKKYKDAIQQLILLLNEQLEQTNFQNTYFEQYFSIEKEKDLHISLVGFIDKIMTFESEGKTYVVVIDYKTGTLHNDFNKAIYGMDMQLLIYLYLLKNTSKIENPIFSGMYLQSILTDTLPFQKGKTYLDLIRANTKLNGYTNSDFNQLKNFDTNYEENSYIKGIKVKKDGSFYGYSKVLTDEQINRLLEIVDKNINRVISSIKTGYFPINPKRLSGNLVGCEFCPYMDICYKKMEDVVDLKEYKNLEFIGGEENDTREA